MPTTSTFAKGPAGDRSGPERGPFRRRTICIVVTASDDAASANDNHGGIWGIPRPRVGRRQVVPSELDARPLVIVVTEEEAWAIDALRQLP